jgi:hypothetical protein
MGGFFGYKLKSPATVPFAALIAGVGAALRRPLSVHASP